MGMMQSFSPENRALTRRAAIVAFAGLLVAGQSDGSARKRNRRHGKNKTNNNSSATSTGTGGPGGVGGSGGSAITVIP
jgi:hypothetical protein